MAYAIIAALVITSLSGLHVYWALGGRWPGTDDADLAARVVGTTSFPPPLACVAVAAALLTGAALVLLAEHGIGGPIVRAGAWAVSAVFVARGVVGLFDGRIRPAIREHPYHRPNLVLYSPLCLAIAALVAAGQLAR